MKRIAAYAAIAILGSCAPGLAQEGWPGTFCAKAGNIAGTMMGGRPAGLDKSALQGAAPGGFNEPTARITLLVPEGICSLDIDGSRDRARNVKAIHEAVCLGIIADPPDLKESAIEDYCTVVGRFGAVFAQGRVDGMPRPFPKQQAAAEWAGDSILHFMNSLVESAYEPDMAAPVESARAIHEAARHAVIAARS